MSGIEQVMVVPRENVAPYLVEYGLVREQLDEALDAILDGHFFLDRLTAEMSPQYKQIIPYVVIRHAESFFLLQRTQKQTEARLHHKLSLGIGGHINPDTPELLDGLHKELEEEVHVAGDYDLTFVGILNDDTTEVGSVQWPLDDARDDLQRFIGRVIRHRQRGADLVWEAYNVDIGGVE